MSFSNAERILLLLLLEICFRDELDRISTCSLEFRLAVLEVNADSETDEDVVVR